MKKVKSVFVIMGLMLLMILTRYKPSNHVVLHNQIKDSVNVVESVLLKDNINFVRIPNLPSNFDTIPGGNNLYRSSQPSLKQLEEIIKSYNIQVVIRMNAKESTNVTPEQEMNLVQSMGKKYVWFNAHMGYQKGKGYVTSLDSIQPYLNGGNALIHCTHGADRTGYQVAKYLQNNFGWSRQELWYYTIKYNNWERNIKNGQMGYVKYMEAFYPYDLWKKEIL